MKDFDKIIHDDSDREGLSNYQKILQTIEEKCDDITSKFKKNTKNKADSEEEEENIKLGKNVIKDSDITSKIQKNKKNKTDSEEEEQEKNPKIPNKKKDGKNKQKITSEEENEDSEENNTFSSSQSSHKEKEEKYNKKSKNINKKNKKEKKITINNRLETTSDEENEDSEENNAKESKELKINKKKISQSSRSSSSQSSHNKKEEEYNKKSTNINKINKEGKTITIKNRQETTSEEENNTKELKINKIKISQSSRSSSSSSDSHNLKKKEENNKKPMNINKIKKEGKTIFLRNRQKKINSDEENEDSEENNREKLKINKKKNSRSSSSQSSHNELKKPKNITLKKKQIITSEEENENSENNNSSQRLRNSSSSQEESNKEIEKESTIKKKKLIKDFNELEEEYDENQTSNIHKTKKNKNSENEKEENNESENQKIKKTNKINNEYSEDDELNQKSKIKKTKKKKSDSSDDKNNKKINDNDKSTKYNRKIQNLNIEGENNLTNKTKFLILEDKNKETFEIETSCKIGSSENGRFQITGVTKKKISINYAEINFIDGNYLIKDDESSSGIFIKLIPGTQIKISKNMCFNVGSTFFKIISLESNLLKIGVAADKNFTDMQIKSSEFGDKKKIIFGKDPKKLKSYNFIDFPNDDNFVDIHGVISYRDIENFFLLSAFPSKEGVVWFNLKKPDNSKYPFCKLFPKIEIKFSDQHIYTVKNVNVVDLKSCSKCKETANSIYLPCLHSVYCFDCAKNERNCEQCRSNIKSVEEIINLNEN